MVSLQSHRNNPLSLCLYFHIYLILSFQAWPVSILEFIHSWWTLGMLSNSLCINKSPSYLYQLWVMFFYLMSQKNPWIRSKYFAFSFKGLHSLAVNFITSSLPPQSLCSQHHGGWWAGVKRCRDSEVDKWVSAPCILHPILLCEEEFGLNYCNEPFMPLSQCLFSY